MKTNFECSRRGLIVNSKSDEIIRDNKRNENKVLRKKGWSKYVLYIKTVGTYFRRVFFLSFPSF